MRPTKAIELILSGKLPPGTIVEDSLHLQGNSLTTLPEGLEVEDWLNIWGSTSLTTLPEGLKVGGSLDVMGCTSLTTLPKNLKVGGWLYLFGCTSLTTLPKDLKIGRGLDLRGCTSLQLPYGIPEGVKGVVYADEDLFKANKDYLLQMVNIDWDGSETKDVYMKILAE